MTTAQNKKIVRRMFEEAMNQKNLSLVNELIADKYVNHDMPGATGPDGMRKIIETFFDGFPDMQIRLQEVIGEGNMVATRGEWTGTHKGSFMGIPATGKRVKINYIDMWRMEDGKGVENWVQMDIPGLMQQLGVTNATA